MDRLWDTAELGITPHLRRKLERQNIRCGDGMMKGSTNPNKEQGLITKKYRRLLLTVIPNEPCSQKIY